MNRRSFNTNSNVNSQPIMDEASWKNVPENSSIMNSSNNSPSLNVDGSTQGAFPQSSIPYGGSSTPYAQTGQNSPAPNHPMVFGHANATGSSTPQYTSSPAPSGSSTPGSQNMTGPFAQPSNSGNFSGPFGSPSAISQFARSNNSSTPFTPGPFTSQAIFNIGAQFNALSSSASFGHGGGHSIMGGSQQLDRIDPGFRRHNSYFNHTEHRVFEINKRLQQRTEESDNCWWDSFTTEFFEDDAKLTVLFCLEDGLKRYTIGRTLIPRFFRSIFEGGVSDLYFQLKHAKESFHNTLITLDCDQCTVITQHGKPFFTKVCADARLILEFLYDDYMRIKSWHMTIKGHRELIPRSVIGSSLPSDPMILEQITKNITRAGITNSTLNYLRLCVILEPMQELMSKHKAYALSPRDCLKTTLSQKWQRMCAPPGKKDSQRPVNKRRKRKASNSTGGQNTNTPPVNNQKRSPSGPNFSLTSQDVMVVGEPTLMGGEFGEEDERLITRLENSQYDSTNILDHENHAGFTHSNSPISNSNPWNIDRTSTIPSSPGNGSSQNNTNSSDIDKKSPILSQ